jgi:D-alanine-D-alanine ligase
MQKKLKVGVVFGGPSSEHEVSLNSGKNVLRNLDTKKYTAIAIKIPKKVNWLIPFIQKVKKVDVAFLALHGRFGEDGKIQAI